MKYKYICKTDSKGWFIVLNDYISSDSGVAMFLGITEEEYAKILITKFNGIIKKYSEIDSGIFFDEKEYCRNAISYLYKITDKYLVAKELIGG